VAQLPAAMPKTIRATDQLLRSGCRPETRHRALELLLALAAVECHASTGGPAVVLPGLLRELVIVTTRLVGRAWLESNAEETAFFTRLQNSLHAPPLPDLDHLLACLLSDRFGLPGPSREPSPDLTHHRSIAAGADNLARRAGLGPPRQPVALPDSRPHTGRGARRLSAATALDGPRWDESRRDPAERPGAHPCDTAGSATSNAAAAAVPTWIGLLRRVNLGMREVRSGGRRRSTSRAAS
jgi:hypothetical protein